MDIIPVLDLARGVAVRAQARRPLALRAGGVRARARARSATPVALLRRSAPPRRQRPATSPTSTRSRAAPSSATLLRELAELETGFAGAIMVDAGAHTPESTFEVLACGASQVVVGLETLRAFTDLADIVRVVGEERVVFSLDLRLGQPHPAPGDARRGGRRSPTR